MTALESMKKMITEVAPEMEAILDQNLQRNEKAIPEIETEVEEKDKDEDKNVLKKWISSMEQRVASILEEEEADDLNPRYCPTFSKRLLKQLPTIPLWSSTCRDKFGVGRVPASSAPVELEFSTIKMRFWEKSNE